MEGGDVLIIIKLASAAFSKIYIVLRHSENHLFATIGLLRRIQGGYRHGHGHGHRMEPILDTELACLAPVNIGSNVTPADPPIQSYGGPCLNRSSSSENKLGIGDAVMLTRRTDQRRHIRAVILF